MIRAISNKITLGAILLLPLLFPVIALAAPTLSITPSSGYIAEGKSFTIDILIDSDEEELILARSVLKFDPTKVRITKAERNNGLFITYPADQQTTDNTNGVVMLTGFSQSGSGTPYVTEGEPDVFGRVTFIALKDGIITFDWEYSGQDEPFNTVLMADGSPPQNVLQYKPATARFTIQDTGDDVVQQPKTGILEIPGLIPGAIGMIGGVSLFTGSSVMFNVSKRIRRKKYRTIVEYDE